MTTNPPEEPQAPGVPPTPPPAPAYEAPTPPPAPAYETPPQPAGAYPPAGGAYPPSAGYGTPPPAPGYAPAYGAPAQQLSDSDQRMWATLAHAGGIVLGFVAPLVVWLVQKGKGQFVEEQSKEALNFQILVTIAYIVSGILAVVTFGVLSPLYFIVWVVSVIFSIMAAVATNKGEAYRYPVNWRIVK